MSLCRLQAALAAMLQPPPVCIDGCGCQVVNAIITATNITTTVLYYNCLPQPCMRCCVFHRKSKRAEDKVGTTACQAWHGVQARLLCAIDKYFALLSI